MLAVSAAGASTAHPEALYHRWSVVNSTINNFREEKVTTAMTLQAPTTPATITLADGKERVLRFSNGALKTIKKEYGVSIMRQGVGKLFETVDEDQLPKLLVLGLDHKYDGGQPGINEAAIDELLDAQNMAMALQQVIQALGSSVLKNALDLILRGMAAVAAAQEQAANPAPEKPTPDQPETPKTTVM